MFNNVRLKKKIKEIQPIVDEKLIDLNLLKIDNGKKEYLLGSSKVADEIRKQILKDKYNIDYNTMQEKHPNWNID